MEEIQRKSGLRMATARTIFLEDAGDGSILRWVVEPPNDEAATFFVVGHMVGQLGPMHEDRQEALYKWYLSFCKEAAGLPAHEILKRASAYIEENYVDIYVGWYESHLVQKRGGTQ